MEPASPSITPMHYNFTDSLNLNDPENIDNMRSFVAGWLNEFSDDYIAHALRPHNFYGVVKSGHLMSGEELLRKEGSVEYEKGEMGSRGEDRLPMLDVNKMQDLSLKEEDKVLLSELKALFKEQQSQMSDAEYQEFRKLEKKRVERGISGNKIDLYIEGFRSSDEYMNFRDSKFTSQELEELKALPVVKRVARRNQLTAERISDDELKEFKDKCFDEYTNKILNSKLSQEELTRWKELLPKVKLDRVQYSKLKWLQRIENEGFIFRDIIRPTQWTENLYSRYGILQKTEPSADHYCNPTKRRYEESLGNQGQAEVFQARIAYDQHLGNPLDKYLTGKYEKWMKQDPAKKQYYLKRLYSIRRNQFMNAKLLPEICAEKNGVRWKYGNIAILRGNPADIAAGDSHFQSYSEVTKGSEVLLLEPFQTGEFFNLPLVQKDTLILGEKPALQPFAKDLVKMGAKFAYLEDLTPEQRTFFKKG